MTLNEDNKNVANELETKIIQQIEYYFSDINLSRDKFMKDVIAKDDGWVPLDTLLTFNRLKSLSADKSVIIGAIRKSTANLIEISEGEDKLRRSVDKPLPAFDEQYTRILNERTVHIKGFPETTKLDDVMTFCTAFGSVENIEMRRHFRTKKFKGCIFVTFVNKEDAEKVLDTKELKYEDNSLQKEDKINYFKRKQEFNEMMKNKKDGKKGVKKENNDANDDLNDDKEEKSEEKPVKSVIKLESAVMKLKGIDDNIKFTDIKEVLKKYGNVSYVEDVKQNESLIRFGDKEGAKTALEKIKSEGGDDSDEVKIEIGGKQVIVEVLTGEEEEKYWDEYEKNRMKSNNKMSQKKKEWNRGGGRGKGRNMWQRGRKRGYQGRGNRDGNKRVKTEGD